MANNQSSTAVFSARNVVVARNGRRVAVLPDIHLDKGRSIAVVGQSGAGKTTALMALAGIRAPEQGQIAIEGTELWRLASAARDRFRGRRIGLVFQSFHLIEAVSVLANLTVAASCAGLPPDKSRADELLDRLGIRALRDTRADRISQGQAQRVAVARALFNRPAVIFADEPTSALDDRAATQMLTLLKEAALHEGAALVIATHDRRVIDAVDETIAIGSPT